MGNALAAKLRGAAYRVYAIMGDGEQQEGSVWEAAMAAGHHKLDNLCAIVDVNRLQIDGWVKDVMNVEPLAEKYAAFGWNVIEIDGHDMRADSRRLSRARARTHGPADGDSRADCQGQGRFVHGERSQLARHAAEKRAI